MIKWEEYKFNEIHSVQIVDEDKTYNLKVKVVEYEWSVHRHPFLADVQVVESNDTETYPLDSIMRLPIETEDFVNFLLFAPCHMSPARELKRKGTITLLN